MTDLSAAAKALIAAAPGEGTSAKDVAGRIVGALDQLTTHLSRLIGNQGVATLLNRTLVLSSSTYPWLAAAKGDHSLLRDVLEQQDPLISAEAFAEVFSTFVGLLKRLIGDGLVDRLLDEVWPAVFPQAVKETP